MIPKIIHYCWFGGKPLTGLAKKCIDSWKKNCPDYEIMEWNESNFDINENTYVREAYDSKKWAFITDYVRLKVLCTYGGIYMDTDVEVLKPLDCFLNEKAFSGFEDMKKIPTGIMGGEKGFTLFVSLLEAYEHRHFILEDGTLDLTPNTDTITEICLAHGLKLDNSKQNIEGFVLYPKDFFCPKSYLTGEIVCTDNTYVIHHFAGSWQSSSIKLKRVIKSIIGVRLTIMLRKIIRLYRDKRY